MVKLSSTNPFGIDLDVDIDQWAEGYIKELEEQMPNIPPEEQTQTFLSFAGQSAFIQGYIEGKRVALRFVRGET